MLKVPVVQQKEYANLHLTFYKSTWPQNTYLLLLSLINLLSSNFLALHKRIILEKIIRWSVFQEFHFMPVLEELLKAPPSTLKSVPLWMIKYMATLQLIL